MDMIVAGESPSDISDKIKDILFTKSAAKIDAVRPTVANSLLETKRKQQLRQKKTK